MRVITLEEHMSTERFISATASPQRQQGPMAEFWKKMNDALLDIGDGRIAAMDAAGVDVQVLSFAGGGLNDLDAGLATEMSAEANHRMAAAVAAHPTRLAAFAALPVQAPDTAAEMLESHVQKHGFKGALIAGTVSGKFLDLPEFLPIFEAAAALDVPIYLHPAPPPQPVRDAYYGDLDGPLKMVLSTAGWGWHVETGLHSLRLMASGLFDRLPQLKLIIGHMGENLPYSISRANDTLSRAGLNLQRSFIEYLQENFWVTNSGYFTLPPVLCAREILKPDHLMLSVDYPFSQMGRGHQFLEDLRTIFSEEQIAAIASGNAANLLKL